MPEVVQISFDDSYETESPYTVVYNPRVMPAALYSQVMRFGLIHAATNKTFLSGQLKGSRESLLSVIQSYGCNVQIVPQAV